MDLEFLNKIHTNIFVKHTQNMQHNRDSVDVF